MNSNYEVYDRNVDEHAERTSMDNLPDSFIELLDEFESQVSGSVLDVGCGVGRDLEYLLEQSNDIKTGVGVDLASNMVAEACSRSDEDGTEYVRADATALPFDNETFDGIWCPATVFLLGFEGMCMSLKEIARVSRSDATAMVAFKLGDSESAGSGYYTRERWDEEVMYYYVSEDEAVSLCRDAGFSIRERYVFSFGETDFCDLFLEPNC